MARLTHRLEMEMRTLRLALSGLLLAGVAACTTTPGANPGQSATTPSPPPCPVGSWTTTGVTSNATAGGVTLSFDGGSGVKVTIDKDGKVKADFSGMKPVVFSTQIAATPVKGEISYQGSEDGTVDLSATDSPNTPATATGGSGGTGGSAAPTTTPTGTGSGAGKAWHPTGK